MVQVGVESENGWRPAKAAASDLEWVKVPGTTVSLQLMKGIPSTIMKAYAADYNAYVEKLRDPDSAGFTPTNSVATSNHLNGTAMDLNWDSHPFQVSYAGYSQGMIIVMREMLTFYEGLMFWSQDWDSPKDCMHHQMGYDTWNNQDKCRDFIARKIRADGFSTFRRGATTAPVPAPVPAPASTGSKVLKFDSAVVPQEVYYDCGPAATQVVLNSRGIIASETDLIRKIGTTTNGTDYVGLIEPVLNQFLPNGKYRSVYLPNDPPTKAQKDQLWANITQSIDAGYGVVMNWVAPPSNYPRGVKGSPNPAYGGGTVFHYVACMGYDSGGGRSLYMADSGFRPFMYWISFDQAASLIPPKGYCYSTAAPVAVTPPAQPDTGDWLNMASNQEKLDFIYGELHKKGPSRSLFASDSDPVDTLLGFEYNTNAHAWDILTAVAYLLGIPSAVTAVERVAAQGVANTSFAAGNPASAKLGQDLSKGLVAFKKKLEGNT